MSSIGLPGTNGFIGEFMVMTAAFVSDTLGQHGKLQAIIAALGVILAAIYMLHAVLKMFWGPIDKKKNETLTDVTGREKWILAPLIALVFWIGIVPSFFLTPMEASVGRFVNEWSLRANSARQDGDARILGGAPAAEAAEPEGETAEVAEPDEDGPHAEAPADRTGRVAALAPQPNGIVLNGLARNGGAR
jgi:NADH-quinone oxidoreductase subunit M